jgi:hypothetical protein
MDVVADAADPGQVRSCLDIGSRDGHQIDAGKRRIRQDSLDDRHPGAVVDSDDPTIVVVEDDPKRHLRDFIL